MIVFALYRTVQLVYAGSLFQEMNIKDNYQMGAHRR